VTDAAGGANSACGMNESLDTCLSNEGWEGNSVPGVIALCVDIEARACEPIFLGAFFGTRIAAFSVRLRGRCGE